MFIQRNSFRDMEFFSDTISTIVNMMTSNCHFDVTTSRYYGLVVKVQQNCSLEQATVNVIVVAGIIAVGTGSIL